MVSITRKKKVAAAATSLTEVADDNGVNTIINVATMSPAKREIKQLRARDAAMGFYQDDAPEDAEIRDRYKDVFDIKVECNGMVEPSTINIGNRYEGGVVKLLFDTSNFRWYDSTISQYTATITFIEEDGNYFTYEFDGEEFDVPQKVLSTKGSTLTCVVCFKELRNDEPTGNISDEEETEDSFREVLTTAPIICNLNTAINNEINIDILASVSAIEDDSLNSLSKCEIKLTASADEKNTFILSDNVIGTTFDNYIRFFSFEGNSYLELNNCYIYFEDKNKKFLGLIKFNSKGYAWIPNTITSHPGDLNINLIASDLDRKIYISNPIACKIVNNNLKYIDMLSPNSIIEPSILITADDFKLSPFEAEGDQYFECK